MINILAVLLLPIAFTLTGSNPAIKTDLQKIPYELPEFSTPVRQSFYKIINWEGKKVIIHTRLNRKTASGEKNSPSHSASPAPSVNAEPSPSASPSPSPSITPSPTPTISPTPNPTPSPTPKASDGTAEATEGAATPTPTPSPTPTPTPTVTPSPTPSPSPTPTPTPNPTLSPTPSISPTPTPTPTVTPSAALTASEIISLTNSARSQNGSIAPLAENSTLDKVAEARLNDMFQKQYFAHLSPTGVQPWDWATQFGYQYITIGENIAMGTYSSSADMVNAWMASSGHRANILNTKYEEIGVAVGQGMFSGRKTWIGVQIFGTQR